MKNDKINAEKEKAVHGIKKCSKQNEVQFVKIVI